MAARNPYERRRDERDPGATMLGYSGPLFGMESAGPRVSPIELPDLEALVSSVAAREHRRMDHVADQREQEGRRQGWDEGHEAGFAEGRAVGRQQLLARIDESVGEEVRVAQEKLLNAIPRVDGQSKDQRIVALERAVGLAESLLGVLIAEHHAGFEKEPF